MEKRRGATLTIFAILFGLLAISNFMKPLKMSGDVGFVFLGTKLSGAANAIMGPLFGIILATYAYGIWTMKKFALPIAYFYAAYVILNLVLYIAKSRGAGFGQLAGLILYPLVAISVSSGSAYLLHRRRSELT